MNPEYFVCLRNWNSGFIKLGVRWVERDISLGKQRWIRKIKNSPSDFNSKYASQNVST